MSAESLIPGVDNRRKHRGDPAALEVLTIREWAEELAALADDWLTAREGLPRAPGRAGRGP